MSRRPGPVRLLMLLATLLLPAAATAQFSPGDLSRPHAELEGSTQCLECHSSGEGVSPELCLSCHGNLRLRIESGQGLHAGDEYERCESCHMDHNGEEFELVFWGEAGIESFDHSDAGYLLEGAHRELECRECHREEHISAQGPLLAAGKSLDRTFLGLDAACLSCHTDPHAGLHTERYATERCLDCHTNEAWKPASGFDHRETEFPLTGRHQRVACGECHEGADSAGSTASPSNSAPVSPTPIEAGSLLFTGVRYAACTDCHTDPHQNRLGSNCESCHSTNGWIDTRATTSFDHDRTRYPLRGRHVALACETCHAPGAALTRRSFAACTDCHDDAHEGQFESRGDRGACESCHTVEGFSPSGFAMAMHQESPFPLEGSHQAVACDQCHEPVDPAQLRAEGLTSSSGRVSSGSGRARVRNPGAPIARFRFAATGCADCHDDPHREESRELSGDGCESCHSVDDWLEVTFDHSSSALPLTGAHLESPCAVCHRPDELSRELRLTGLGTTCQECHDDPHAGQFAARENGGTCESCHQTDDWKQLLFDHDRDSRFPLSGGHQGVPCVACHIAETTGEQSLVRYAPTPSECRDCHR